MIDNNYSRILLGCLLVLGFCSDAAISLAVPPTAEKHLSHAIAEARRGVESARLRLRLYEKVEYPGRARQLENEIKLTAAEVDKYRELLAEYKQITSRTVPEPLIVSRQTTELALLGAELKLTDLREENHLLIRYHTDQCRLYQLEVEAAEARLRALLDEL